jgi:nitrate/nitrite transporter NarK
VLHLSARDSLIVTLLIAVSNFVWLPIGGALSDRIGRKKIIMAGCLLAALTYFPIFNLLTHYANPTLEDAQRTAPVTVVADPKDCSFQFNPVGTAKFTSSCDIAKSFLARNAVNYANAAASAGSVAQVKIGDMTLSAANAAEFNKAAAAAIKEAGYPAKADPARINYVMVTLLLTVLVIYVTMVYGPIAAMLVEMFPTRIRYTSMSLPYHIGNGWFGGFLPTTAFAIVATTGNIYNGLWYPIVIALMTLALGTLFIRETNRNSIHH